MSFFSTTLTPPPIPSPPGHKQHLARLKQLMADAHPDRGGSCAAFIAAREAYDDARQTPPVLQARLDYAALGWWTFPAPASGEKKSLKSKKQVGSRGVNWGATLDPAVIRAEFSGGFFDHALQQQNVGIVTGIKSGIFVVECDTSEHGDGINGAAVLRRWEATRGKLPPTLMARSPSGSVHYYFKHPGKGVRIRLAIHILGPESGVDCKGDGGMVLAPPSYRPPRAASWGRPASKGKPATKDQPARKGGFYQWINKGHPITEAPKWLLHRCTEKWTRPPAARSGQRGVQRPVSRDLVQHALDQFSSDCDYDYWFEICCALRAEFGDTDAGFGLFDDWSSLAPGRYSHDACVAKWKEAGKVSAFSIGTVFHYAEQVHPGWRARYEAKQLVENSRFSRALRMYRNGQRK